ncbi:hypothetical protein EAE96_010589 [Botrytis aclada]|nr:hypothetical protein EAE96_010589 [Botrytis aclada]
MSISTSFTHHAKQPAIPSRLKTLESNVYLPILYEVRQSTYNTKLWCLCRWEVPSPCGNAGGMSEAPEARPSKRGFNTFSFCGCLELPEPARNVDTDAALKLSPATPTNYSFDGFNMGFNTSPTTPTDCIIKMH